MLFIGIGLLLIIFGLTTIYFASQMKPEKLIHSTENNQDVENDPYRGRAVRLGEFVKENIVRKIFTYFGILFLLVGAGFIFKSIVLEVPADKVAIRYIAVKDFNTVPKMLVEYGPGWYIINPLNTYMFNNLDDIYFTDVTKELKDVKARLKDRIVERDICWKRLEKTDGCLGKLAIWERTYGKPGDPNYCNPEEN